MKRDPIGTLFPNGNPNAGSYSPTAFCITLNLTTSRQLQDIKPGKTDMLDHRRVLYHEMRHHIDHLSTLWGQEKIVHLYEAVNARLAKTEADFPKIIRYKIEEKQFHYDDYFTEQYNRVPYRSPADRWIWQLSSGARFNYLGELQLDHPILFIKFGSQAGVPINRVPLSIASLLETNAMYEETVVEQQYLNTLPKERQLKVRIRLDVRFTAGVLYNQDFAVYNAAVHLTANILQLSDAYQAFKIASAVATIALNLPAELLAGIPLDNEYLKVWQDRPEHFIQNQDLGFLYFSLLLNYRKRFNEEAGYDLVELLASNKLPEADVISAMINAEMDKNIGLIQPATHFNQFFREHLQAGKKLFELRGLDGLRQPLADTIVSGQYIPFIVTKDLPVPHKITYAQFFKDPQVMEQIAINDWYNLAGELSHKMEEFYRVRGL